MPNYCVVPYCNNDEGGFRFPIDKEQRSLWERAVKRMDWKAKPHSVVCKRHFLPEDLITTDRSGSPRARAALKPGAVPSVFQWSQTKPLSLRERRKRIRDLSAIQVPQKQVPVFFSETDIPCASNVTVGEERATSETNLTVSKTCIRTYPVFEAGRLLDDVEACQPEKPQSTKHTRDVETNSTIESLVNRDIFVKPYLSLDRIQHSPELFHHYTGIETFQKFECAFHSLGPNVNFLNYVYSQKCDVPPVICFFIMLVFLRCHYPFVELARMFSLSSTTIRNICFTWIKFCAEQWREIDIWPSRELVDFYCPSDFKEKFPNTRVILDGTEIPIDKPSNPIAQRATFSTYKHRNTVKVLVGATPGGLISYVSEAYGGSVSDRQLIERSSLLDKVEPGDVIMADKGFNVQDLFALKDVTVNTPTFFKKKNRMTPETVAKDKKISSKRVHIERIIGSAKSFKILKQPLNARETSLASEIIFICFMLVNFRKNIVSPFA